MILKIYALFFKCLWAVFLQKQYIHIFSVVTILQQYGKVSQKSSKSNIVKSERFVARSLTAFAALQQSRGSDIYGIQTNPVGHEIIATCTSNLWWHELHQIPGNNIPSCSPDKAISVAANQQCTNLGVNQRNKLLIMW